MASSSRTSIRRRTSSPEAETANPTLCASANSRNSGAAIGSWNAAPWRNGLPNFNSKQQQAINARPRLRRTASSKGAGWQQNLPASTLGCETSWKFCKSEPSCQSRDIMRQLKKHLAPNRTSSTQNCWASCRVSSRSDFTRLYYCGCPSTWACFPSTTKTKPSSIGS